jgi:hypothetical protein
MFFFLLPCMFLLLCALGALLSLYLSQVRKGRGLAGGGSSIKKSAAAVLKSGKRQGR